MDLQRPMLDRVRAKARSPNIRVIQADAMHLPTASASIDIVFAVTVLGEVPVAATAIAEMARLLKPGGLLSISERLPDPDF